MITRARIQLATALAVLSLGGIAACGYAGASADVTAPAPSLTTAPSSASAVATPAPASTSASNEATETAPSGASTTAPTQKTGVTTAQLLRGHDFTDHGWGAAEVTRGFEGDAGLNLPRCSSAVAPDADGYVGLEAWLYGGSQTQGVEMAIGFEDTASVSTYAEAYASVVTGRCRTVLGDEWQVLKVIPSAPNGATATQTWLVREQKPDGPVLRVISVITAGRRAAVLHLSSTISDPSTVDLTGLLQTATDRLVSS